MAEKKLENLSLNRLASLFDDGSFVSLDTCDGCGARIAYGSVNGTTVFAYAEGDNGGVFTPSCASKLSRVYDLAEKTGSPVVAVYDSCGVCVKDATETMDSCSVILGKIARLSGVVPQISVVAGTCGGFTALAASLADLCVMDRDASLFLTAPFLDGAAGNGTASFAGKCGLTAAVEEGEEVFAKVRTLLGLLPLNNMDSAPVFEFDEPEIAGCDAASLADAGSLTELYAGEGNVKTYLGTLSGSTAGFLCVSGRLCAADSARAARLVSLCDSYSLPVLTLLDSEGFVRDAKEDMEGGIRGAALLTSVLASATCPKICAVTGNAVGSAYYVFCGKGAGNDAVIALDTAVISALEPAAAVSVVWEDRIEKESDLPALAKEYAATEACAANALKKGLVDRIVTAAELRQVLIGTADMLASKRVSGLPRKHSNLPY